MIYCILYIIFCILYDCRLRFSPCSITYNIRQESSTTCEHCLVKLIILYVIYCILAPQPENQKTTEVLFAFSYCLLVSWLKKPREPQVFCFVLVFLSSGNYGRGHSAHTLQQTSNNWQHIVLFLFGQSTRTTSKTWKQKLDVFLISSFGKLWIAWQKAGYHSDCGSMRDPWDQVIRQGCKRGHTLNLSISWHWHI